MEGSLSLLVLHDPGLFQEVGLDVPALRVKLEVEEDVHVLALCVCVCVCVCACVCMCVYVCGMSVHVRRCKPVGT